MLMVSKVDVPGFAKVSNEPVVPPIVPLDAVNMPAVATKFPVDDVTLSTSFIDPAELI